jgi:hypothetical protein
MKKILCLLALVPTICLADTYWVYVDENGAQTVLTNEKPKWCAGMTMMFFVNPSNVIDYGCWGVMADMVHIQFKYGFTVAHKYDKFQKKTESKNIGLMELLK